jgi:hypothetical protein
MALYFAPFAAAIIIIGIIIVQPSDGILQIIREDRFWIIFVFIWLTILSLMYILSTYKIRDFNLAGDVDKLVQRIRSGKHINSRGVSTVVASNQSWRDTVELLIKNADCVVVDTSELNENVTWETTQTFKFVPAEAIILSWAIECWPESNSIDELISDHMALLGPIVGNEILRRARFSPYLKNKQDNFVGTHFSGVELSKAIANKMYYAQATTNTTNLSSAPLRLN